MDTPIPAIGDPGQPSGAVTRFELPALGWLFVAAAGLVVMARLSRVAGDLSGLIAASAILSALASAFVALLPAALLFGMSDAPRTHRLLFSGLAGVAAAVWLWAFIPFLLLGPGAAPWLTTGAFVVAYLVQGAAALLVGMGLLQLRTRGPGRGWLLVVIVGIDLGFMLVQLGLPAAEAHQSFVSPWLAPMALVTAAGGFSVWVPVTAWLDHDPARAFWGLLALGFPLGVLGRVVGVGQTMVILAPRSGGLSSDGAYLMATLAGAVIGAVGSLLALAAYARETPGTPTSHARSREDEPIESRTDWSDEPSRPHGFRDEYEATPVFGGLLPGRMAVADAMEGRQGRCVLCGKTRDDPIHAPPD